MWPLIHFMRPVTAYQVYNFIIPNSLLRNLSLLRNVVVEWLTREAGHSKAARPPG